METYILKGKEIIKADLLEWSKFIQSDARIIKKTIIGNTRVSTIFLGVSYTFNPRRILLFETMIFGGIFDEWQDRYEDYDSAIKGHDKACEMVKQLNQQS